MLKLITAASIAALALTSATASAQENSFSGFRVEAHGGLDVFSSKYSYHDLDTGTDDDSFSERANHTGVLYGIGAGYDAQVTNKLVVGVEANLDFSNAKSRNFEEYINDNSYADSIKIGREIEVAARAGYLVTPSTLVYVKAGYANARIKANGERRSNASSAWVDEKYGFNRGGYRVGAGAETLLGSNVYAKVEYRYTNYKDLNPTYNYTDGDTDSRAFSRHQAVAGVGIRF